jgi:hypothetical protein
LIARNKVDHLLSCFEYAWPNTSIDYRSVSFAEGKRNGTSSSFNNISCEGEEEEWDAFNNNIIGVCSSRRYFDIGLLLTLLLLISLGG